MDMKNTEHGHSLSHRSLLCHLIQMPRDTIVYVLFDIYVSPCRHLLFTIYKSGMLKYFFKIYVPKMATV